MRPELRKILTRVFIALLLFLIGVVIYKQGNPYAYPGLENRILFVLVPSGIVLLYLYLEERETRNRLFSVIMVTIGRLHESKFMRFCEGIWERSPSLIRTRVSKVLAVVYIYLHKMSGYMLKQDPKQAVSYVFLGMLLIVALQSIFPQPSLEWARIPVMIAAVVLGVVTFYLNRDKLDEIEEEARQEEIEEKKREMEFAEKYPRINRVWGVRWVVRWMYKEGWWYSRGLIIVIFVGFALRIWNLGRLGLWADEGQVYIVTKNILTTGLPYLDSGYLYTRDLPHLYLTSLSIVLFGGSEFALRFPSVIAGTALIAAMYLTIKNYTTKSVAIIGTIITAIHPWIIEYSRLSRSYILMLLFVTMTFYFFSKIVATNFTLRKNYILFSIFGSLSCLTHQIGQLTLFLVVPFLFSEWYKFNNVKSKFVFCKSLPKKLVPFFVIIIAIFIYKILLSFSYLRYTDQFMTATPKAGKNLLETALHYIPFGSSFQLSNITFIENSIPIIFILGIVFALTFVLIKIFNPQNIYLKDEIIIITLSTFFITMGFSERDITINRVLLFMFPFLLVACFVFGHKVLKLSSKFNRKVIYISLILILSTSLIETYDIISADYGDPINPYHSSFEGFVYRQDHKTTYEFLNTHYKDNDDLIIVFGNPKFSPMYIRNDLNVDYYVWTGNRATINNKDIYLKNVTLVDNFEEYQNIVGKKNVWIITTYSIGDLYRVNHINNKFKKYVQSFEPIYQSRDPYARVYYIKKHIMI